MSSSRSKSFSADNACEITRNCWIDDFITPIVSARSSTSRILERTVSGVSSRSARMSSAAEASLRNDRDRCRETATTMIRAIASRITDITTL